jgi:Fe-S cluster assembly protein SufD
MSRGIPEPEARRLVVRGFFAELIEQIGVPSVEERLIAAIEAELAKSDAVITGASAPVVSSTPTTEES